MVSSFKRALDSLKDEGIKSFWFKMLSAADIYRRVVLLELSLEDTSTEINAPDWLSIDSLQSDEVGEYVRFRSQDKLSFGNNNPRDILNRLDSGHRCFVARSEHTLLSASWVSKQRAIFNYCDSQITLSSDEIYMYDSFTRPENRGEGISTTLKKHIIVYFKARGYKRIIVGVVPENTPSIRVNLKVGFRPFASTGYVKIGPWRRDFYTEYEAEKYTLC